MAGMTVFAMAACAKEPEVFTSESDNGKIVNLFGPMEKSKPDKNNIARNAFDMTIAIAEEQLGLRVEYRTYTAENYKEKTYDDVTLDRARNALDDIYLLNPDTIQTLGSEGYLEDLSILKNVENLRDVVKVSNTVDGKLVAIPQEVVAYGLFINEELFEQYHLSPPETPEEFLECCRVFKENGIETPVGANRWKPSYLRRHMRIYTMAEILRLKLPRSTAGKRNTAIICAPALNFYRN